MFEGIAGGIAGAMLEYATQKKWGFWKIFFYSFTVFSLLGLLSFHFFFSLGYGLICDFLYALSFGVFAGLVMLGFYYYATTRSNK